MVEVRCCKFGIGLHLKLFHDRVRSGSVALYGGAEEVGSDDKVVENLDFDRRGRMEQIKCLRSVIEFSIVGTLSNYHFQSSWHFLTRAREI